jgi:hypothetical protein
MDKTFFPTAFLSLARAPCGRLCAAVFAIALASGCATRSQTDAPQSTATQENMPDQMQGAAATAASQPLRDIGLMTRKIPYALTRIADPYAEPSGPGCAWLTYELTQLSAALGPEVAVMPVASRESRREKGSRMAMRTARDAIMDAGSNLLPGRGIIRRLSGANNAEELFEAAKERGMVRRGYLKGLSEARNCTS